MQAITEDRLHELTNQGYDCLKKGAEAAVKCDLQLYLGARIRERGEHTNRLINIYHPWDIQVWWCLFGSLKGCICGKWCVAAHLESIGKGKEFSLPIAETYTPFDCKSYCWLEEIKGEGLAELDCAQPYKVVVTVTYRTLCDQPGPIVGYCDLGLVTFFYSAK